MPPIYQPEIAADAIHWAAYHRRRRVYVGFPTVLGPFDDEAHEHSFQTTLTKHRRLAGSLAAGVGAATGALLLRKR